MIPYRLDLAGGWLDQPFISSIFSGSVITLSILSEKEYNKRSGLATSTRDTLIKLHSLGIMPEDQIEAAKLLFRYDNKPGTVNISGAQDSIGLCVKGLSRHFYNGRYWPKSIEICQDEKILDWIESHIYLKALPERKENYDVFEDKNINASDIQGLSECSDKCWKAIMEMNLSDFAYYVTYTYEYQKHLFPNIETNGPIPQCLGYKLAGAGGGGYVIMINEDPCGERIKVRR